MRIAYVIPINISGYDGVLNKINFQVSSWLNQGSDVTVVILTSQSAENIHETALGNLYSQGRIKVFYLKKVGVVPVDLLLDWMGLPSAYAPVKDFIRELNPDLIYTRVAVYQPFFKYLGQRFPLVIEVNTNIEAEYYLQRFQSPKFYLRYLYHSMTRKAMLRDVTGIAAVTTEIAALFPNSKSDVFPNSIDVSQYGVQKYAATPGIKSLIFIGSADMEWQGVDILVELARKLSSIQIHVVGTKGEDYNTKPENIIFHGYLSKTDYLPLIKTATAAIGTLALFRKQMEEACPLKVREYLACCRPVILPYKDTAFELNGYPDWVLKLENSEDAILRSAQKIMDFLNRCETLSLDQEDISRFVDVRHIEANRLRFFRQLIGNNGELKGTDAHEEMKITDQR